MSTPPPVQSRFVHAVSFASLMLQVSEHVFPDQKLFSLSADQRRIVDNETRYLLLQARWATESKAFAEYFGTPLTTVEMVPEGTVLGEKPPEPKATERPGQYA